MAETLPAPFREVFESFESFLDPDRVQAIAEDLRCTQRNRKVHIGMLAAALVLSALQPGADTEGRWLDAGAIYRRMMKQKVSPSALGDRIRALEPLLRELLNRRAQQLVLGTPALRGRLQRFADVIIPDGCAFKLAAAHAGLWPGTGNPAEFKLHAVYSVRASGLIAAGASAGTVHDTVGFEPERWERGALYIWDLGYQSYHRFVEAVLQGAIPLQRLKDKLNPVVLAWYDAKGERHALEGEKKRAVRLEEATSMGMVPATGVLDLDARIRDEKGREVVGRLVCVPFEGADRWYLTTLPRAQFTPHDVAELYRLRWEVELFFRTLRGATRLDDVRRMKHPGAKMVAILSSILAATLGQELTTALNDWENDPCEGFDEAAPPRMPPQRSRPLLAAAERVVFSPGDAPLRRRVGLDSRSA